LAGAVITLAVAAAVVPLLLRTGTGAPASLLADPYLWRVTRFTLLQAGLSASLALVLAAPVALALSGGRMFTGRTLALRIFALPLGLPALVAVLGVVEVWGRQGVVSDGLAWIGLPRLDIYGLDGILIAHVFFNLPLAVRMLLAALDAVPPETRRLAAQLAFSRRDNFRLIEWPVLKRTAPSVFMLVFMLCAASFTVVLILGGGPAATTLEVAIYQALRFDFDPARAVLLALVQIALCLLLQATVLRLGASPALGMGVGTGEAVRPALRTRAAPGDLAVVWLAALFVAAPMAAIALSGLAAPLGRLVSEAVVWRALLTSLAAAGCSALVAVALTAGLLTTRRDTGRLRNPPLWRVTLDRYGGALAGVTLAVPPVVLGAGWFVLAMPHTGSPPVAALAIVTANALMALPFCFAILAPAAREAAVTQDRLALSLGVTGLARLRLIDLPTLKRPLGLAFALAMAMSVGDLGVIALFGSDTFVTLPYLLFQRLGSYRTADAAGLALILAALTLTLVLGAERLARRPAGRRR
jgi:thiamine transport system permease protein